MEELRSLVKSTKLLVHTVDNFGRTALHMAAINGWTNTAKFLLEKVADPNLQDKNGWTTVHYAAKCPVDNVEMLKLLLKKHDLKGMVSSLHYIYICFYIFTYLHSMIYIR